jgi:hypothetical protein
MQRQEQEKGFKEKSPSCVSFFYKGEIGSWRNVLNKKQVQTIIRSHKDVMKQFGYLDKGVIPASWENGY